MGPRAHSGLIGYDVVEQCRVEMTRVTCLKCRAECNVAFPQSLEAEVG